MIKEALQWIAERANTRVEFVGSQTFSTQPLHLIPEPVAKTLTVNSLTGLVEYALSDFDWAADDGRMLLHVISPTAVRLYNGLNSDRTRETFIEAKAELPHFRFGHFLDVEEFNIALQSMFVDGADKADVLKVVGNIKEETVHNIGDDGVSQSVTAKAGVATVAEVKVPNPVILAPYRTFIEVEQPQSSFVFRMRSGPTCALFEADGGAWKNEAMNNIRGYLQDNLSEKIGPGHIVLIA